MEEFEFINHQPESEEYTFKDFEQIQDDYRQLEKKHQAIFEKEKLIFILSHLEAEGLQAVIRDYGVTTVIENSKALYEKTPTKQFSLLQVIQRIEPSKEKRKVLFTKMDGNAHFIADKINEAGNLDYKAAQEGETIPKNYFKNTYSYGDKFLSLSKSMINELREEDNLFLKVYNLATLQTNFSELPNLIGYLVETESQSEFIDEINNLSADTSIYDLTQRKFQEVADEKELFNQELKIAREKLQTIRENLLNPLGPNPEVNLKNSTIIKNANLIQDVINKINNLENSSFRGNIGSLNQDNYYPVSH